MYPITKIRWIIFALLLGIATVCSAYSGGTGTSDDPYQIATAQDLIDLGNEPNDYDKHFILTEDIDLDPNLPGGQVFDQSLVAAVTIYPFENDRFEGTPFSGKFNGQGHAIKHIHLRGEGPLGVFGYVTKDAIVSNLHLYHADINGTNEHVGSLAGYNLGTIQFCHSDGIVRGNSCVGHLVGSSKNGRIISCNSTGSVQGMKWNIGGLVGYNSSDIMQCKSHCLVNGEVEVGGLVGVHVQPGQITQSYCSGQIRGENTIGGFVGYCSASIISCYSFGSVAGIYSIGGLIGNHSSGQITTCYSYCTIRGNDHLGGLIGRKRRSETHSCFWDIDISGATLSAGGTGLSTPDMQDINTYLDAGWDFACETDNGPNYIWFMPEGDYPRLAWEFKNPPACPVGVVELTTNSFYESIAEGVALVDFYADWCSHCRIQLPIMDDVVEQIQHDALVGKFNIDQPNNLLKTYGIHAIPTIILFKDGVEVGRFVGVTEDVDLIAAIRTALSEETPSPGRR